MSRRLASDPRPRRVWDPQRLPCAPGAPRAYHVVVDREGRELCRVFLVRTWGSIDTRPYMARPDELHDPAAWEARHGALD